MSYESAALLRRPCGGFWRNSGHDRMGKPFACLLRNWIMPPQFNLSTAAGRASVHDRLCLLHNACHVTEVQFLRRRPLERI